MTSTTTIVGNLTRDPELRFTPSGQATASFGVAVNRRGQNRQSQEWEEATSFFDVVAWARLAENVTQCLHRGDRVVVNGRLDQRSWENSEGDKRSKVEITANDIGSSLRWPTATMTKNERRSSETVPAGNGSYGPDQEPFEPPLRGWRRATASRPHPLRPSRRARHRSSPTGIRPGGPRRGHAGRRMWFSRPPTFFDASWRATPLPLPPASPASMAEGTGRREAKPVHEALAGARRPDEIRPDRANRRR